MKEKIKILIIEDELDIANQLASSLQKADFDTLHVTNIPDALEALVKYRPLGVSLDNQLDGTIGLNFIKTIYSEDSPVDYIPNIIVVSNWLSPPAIDLLREYKINYYIKSISTFSYTLVADSFSIFFDPVPSSVNMHTLSQDIRPSQLTESDLRKIIHKKLEIYNFDRTKVGYGRLVSGIYYTLLHKQKITLVTIYNDITNDDYQAALKSISRSIETSPAYKPDEKRPTPTEFIFQITTEIENEHF